MQATSHGGCTDTVKESALKADYDGIGGGGGGGVFTTLGINLSNPHRVFVVLVCVVFVDGGGYCCCGGGGGCFWGV